MRLFRYSAAAYDTQQWGKSGLGRLVVMPLLCPSNTYHKSGIQLNSTLPQCNLDTRQQRKSEVDNNRDEVSQKSYRPSEVINDLIDLYDETRAWLENNALEYEWCLMAHARKGEQLQERPEWLRSETENLDGE